jgi:glycine cleavage system aminomethyltransferase T
MGALRLHRPDGACLRGAAEAGGQPDLKLCGLHTLDSCRIEKAYRHFGHDITDEDHVLEAGLGFAVKTPRRRFHRARCGPGQGAGGLDRRMMQFRLKDPEPLMFHNEAIVRDGGSSGRSPLATTGISLAAPSGWAMCRRRARADADLLGSRYEIEIAGARHEAVASLAAMYDPKSERVRG